MYYYPIELKGDRPIQLVVAVVISKYHGHIISTAIKLVSCRGCAANFSWCAQFRALVKSPHVKENNGPKKYIFHRDISKLVTSDVIITPTCSSAVKH